MKDINVGVLFGGCSVEHEVSIRSARTIISGLKAAGFSATPIGVAKSGQWLGVKDSEALLDGKEVLGGKGQGVLSNISTLVDHTVDVLFPIIHGAIGEDGSVQGLCKILNLPFVGPGVLGSALCMDKEMAKRVLIQAGLSVAPFLTVTASSFASLKIDSVVASLGEPLFVKPANLGSSVGITKANAKNLSEAVKYALQFDRKVLIEKAIKGRELECSVLGNESPRASVIGEVLPGEEFYSYDDKYSSSSKATTAIPAKLPIQVSDKIRSTAIAAYSALECEGMARVDFFLTDGGEVLINEINTLPGFTSISMYPKMWEAAGLSLTELLKELVSLALARHKRDSALRSRP
jgi:D-alanine-D-alanine ligase